MKTLLLLTFFAASAWAQITCFQACGSSGGGGLSPTGTYYSTPDGGTTLYGPLFQFTPPPAVASFTQVNMTGASFALAGTNAILFKSTANTGNNTHFAYLAAPATPWTKSIDFTPGAFTVNASNVVGISASDGTKFVDCWIGYSGNGFSVQVFSQASNSSAPSALGTAFTLYGQSGPIRLTFGDDGTNLTCSVSFNYGLSPLQVYSGLETAFLTSKPARSPRRLTQRADPFGPALWNHHSTLRQSAGSGPSGESFLRRFPPSSGSVLCGVPERHCECSGYQTGSGNQQDVGEFKHGRPSSAASARAGPSLARWWGAWWLPVRRVALALRVAQRERGKVGPGASVQNRERLRDGPDLP